MADDVRIGSGFVEVTLDTKGVEAEIAALAGLMGREFTALGTLVSKDMARVSTAIRAMATNARAEMPATAAALDSLVHKLAAIGQQIEAAGGQAAPAMKRALAEAFLDLAAAAGPEGAKVGAAASKGIVAGVGPGLQTTLPATLVKAAQQTEPAATAGGEKIGEALVRGTMTQMDLLPRQVGEVTKKAVEASRLALSFGPNNPSRADYDADYAAFAAGGGTVAKAPTTLPGGTRDFGEEGQFAAALAASNAKALEDAKLAVSMGQMAQALARGNLELLAKSDPAAALAQITEAAKTTTVATTAAGQGMGKVAGQGLLANASLRQLGITMARQISPELAQMATMGAQAARGFTTLGVVALPAGLAVAAVITAVVTAFQNAQKLIALMAEMSIAQGKVDRAIAASKPEVGIALAQAAYEKLTGEIQQQVAVINVANSATADWLTVTLAYWMRSDAALRSNLVKLEFYRALLGQATVAAGELAEKVRESGGGRLTEEADSLERQADAAMRRGELTKQTAQSEADLASASMDTERGLALQYQAQLKRLDAERQAIELARDRDIAEAAKLNPGDRALVLEQIEAKTQDQIRVHHQKTAAAKQKYSDEDRARFLARGRDEIASVLATEKIRLGAIERQVAREASLVQSRLANEGTVLATQKAAAQEAAAFAGLPFTKLAAFHAAEEALVARGLVATLDAIEKAGAARAASLQAELAAATTGSARRQIEQSLKDLVLDMEQQKTQAREAAEAAGVVAAQQAAQAKKKEESDALAREQAAFGRRVSLGQESFESQAANLRALSRDSRASAEERANAATAAILKMREADAVYFAARKQLGTITIEGEIAELEKLVAQYDRCSAEGIAAQLELATRVREIEAQTYERSVQLGEQNLQQQIAQAAKIARSYMEGSQKRFDAEKDVIAKIKQLNETAASAGRSLEDRALAALEKRGQKMVTLKQIQAEVEAQGKRAAQTASDYASGKAVSGDDLKEARALEGTYKTLRETGIGATDAVARGADAMAAAFGGATASIRGTLQALMGLQQAGAGGGGYGAAGGAGGGGGGGGYQPTSAAGALIKADAELAAIREEIKHLKAGTLRPYAAAKEAVRGGADPEAEISKLGAPDPAKIAAAYAASAAAVAVGQVALAATVTQGQDALAGTVEQGQTALHGVMSVPLPELSADLFGMYNDAEVVASEGAATLTALMTDGTGAITEALLGATPDLSEPLTEMYLGAQEAAATGQDALGATVAAGTEALTEALDEGLGEDFGETVTENLDALNEGFTGTFEDLSETAAAGLEGLEPAVADAFGEVAETVDAAMEELPDTVEEGGDAMAAALAGAAKDAGQEFGSGLDDIQTETASLVGSLEKEFDTIEIPNPMTEVLGAYRSGFGAILTEADSFVQTFNARITSGQSAVANNLFESFIDRIVRRLEDEARRV